MEWPRGEARDCKSLYTGSNPVSTSIINIVNTLAIDIGATKIALGIFDSEKNLLSKIEIKIAGANDPWRLIEPELIGLSNSKDFRINKIGIGSAGPIDIKNQTISPVNIVAWRNFPLIEKLKTLFTKTEPVLIGDAIALTLAELKVGAGRGLTNFLGMVVSTGIGGGLVLNGKLHTGQSGNAGHFGHHVVGASDFPCACGRFGCVEAYSSGPSMVRYAVQNGWNGESFEQLSQSNDPIATAAISRGVKYLAKAIINVATVVDLTDAVVGGGVIESGDIFWQPFIENVHAEAKLVQFTQNFRVHKAELRRDAGLIGAAFAADGLD